MATYLNLPRTELALLKMHLGDKFMVTLTEIVTSFVRHAKAQIPNRRQYGSVSKTYKCGDLKVRLESTICDGGLTGVWLTLNNFRGRDTIDLDDFVNKGEVYLMETMMLKEELT